MKQLVYAIPNSEHKLIVTSIVQEILFDNRQQGSESEAGGLIFAKFDFPIIYIMEATLPQAVDQRWRTLFIPNRSLQKKIIKQRFKRRYHFIGEWHTHPESVPIPSALDLESMGDSFLKSRHELNYFVMIIVGNASKKLELWVSIHDGSNCYHLAESKP